MEKVDVYFNLHRLLWSVRCRRTGHVTQHARVVSFAHGAKLVVRPSGRALVLATGQKNVHAFARGDSPEVSRDWKGWQAFCDGLPDSVLVTYNPHKAGHFMRKDSGERVDSVSSLVLIAPQDAAPRVYAIIS